MESNIFIRFFVATDCPGLAFQIASYSYSEQCQLHGSSLYGAKVAISYSSDSGTVTLQCAP